MAHTLSLKQVSISAAGIELVTGLSFDIATGDRVGLLGPSGIGKSTLLRTIARLIDPTEGTIELDDRNPCDIGWPRYRSRVVYVAQRPVLLEDTVRANLKRPFSYHNHHKPYREDDALALIDRLLLESERLTQPATTLSVGQQQRVGLIRALLIEPDFLLLDEPTSALDEESAERVESLLTELTDQGRLGAIFVTHDRQQLERLCHRTVDLNNFRADSPNSRPAAEEATDA